jgi:GT2 family glycosyltransferase
MSEREPYVITVGMATGGTIRTETVARLLPAIWELKKRGYIVNFCPMIGGNVCHNRNVIVTEAIKNNSDYVMFIDNDMMFPADGITRLIDSDKDIMCGPYNQRPLPQGDNNVRVSTVKLVDEEGTLVSGKLPNELSKVGAAGTGFMLIKMKVFEAMEHPWFIDYEDEAHQLHGEDVNFCIKARGLNFEVWINPHLEILHIGHITW